MYFVGDPCTLFWSVNDIKLYLTMYFVGDPCTISSQMELDEAVRLYELNKDSELTLHGNHMNSEIITNIIQSAY